MSKQQTNIGTTPAPSISIFLSNLHLLNLDRRDDWPSISSQTFTRKNTLQNEKTRICCVEWALYRLFEIWDVEESRNVRASLLHGYIFCAHKPSLEARALLPCPCASAVSQPTRRSIEMSQRFEKERSLGQGGYDEEDNVR